MRATNALALAAVLALLFAAVGISHPAIRAALLGNWNFTKSVERNNSTYYRLKVSLTYKGEPQNFDIVVGCNVKQTNYMDGGRTLEVGLIPSVFGRRMSDGKGLVVRPPNACNGETTANGKVPVDLLPIVAIFDDAETLAFGTAYLSEDAYDSPMSVLSFGGSTIEPAGPNDFATFRREQPNLVKRESYHTPSGPAATERLHLKPAPVPMGAGCFGYARFRLFGQERERAHALWPSGQPRYWRPTTSADHDSIDPFVDPERPMQTDRGDSRTYPRRKLVFGLDNGAADRGMPTRHGGGIINGLPGAAFPPSYYPNIGGWISLPWPTDVVERAESLLRDGPRVGASIDFRNSAMRGFAYYRPIPQEFPTGVSYPDPSAAPAAAYSKMPLLNYVDGLDVVRAPPAVDWDWIGGGPALIVERDEFIFKRFEIGLQSTRGDV